MVQDKKINHVSGERRQMTILNLDLVSSTEITSQMDPEEWQENINELTYVAESIAANFNANLDRFHGDGYEIYFKDEDAAYNALHAAIEMKQALTILYYSSGQNVKVRFGVATGDAVVADLHNVVNGKSPLAYGELAHKAARLQENAHVNTIFVDFLTANLSNKNFSFKYVGKLELKGFSNLVEVYQLMKSQQRPTRFENKTRSLSFFTGRDWELSKLLSLATCTVTGTGLVIGIRGEPGIGKSRLAYEFSEEYRIEKTCIFMQCSSTKLSSAFRPFLDYIQYESEAYQESCIDLKSKMIIAYFEKFKILNNSEKAVLLSYAGYNKDQTSSANLSPDDKQKIMRHLLIDLLSSLCIVKPLILVIEDFHWADPSTRSFVIELLDFVQSMPALVILTSRIEPTSEEMFKKIDTIELDKLSEPECQQLIARLNKNNLLKENLVNTILSRSGGNPLYIEEITKSLFEQTTSKDILIEIDKIPESLYGILMAQLDNLPQLKSLTQLASTIGRVFSAKTLARISNSCETMIKQELSVLEEKEIIFKNTTLQQSDYVFKHALIQEVAYNSQLNKSKIKNHKRIADYFLESGHLIDSQPELIAYHLENAKEFILAFEYWFQAGTKSFSKGATRESVELLNRARDILNDPSLEAPVLSIRRDYFLVRAKALNAAEGAKSIDAVKSYEKAAELSEEMQDTDTQIHAIDSQFAIVFNSGNIKEIHELAKFQYKVGCDKAHIIGTISGLQSLGMTEFARGNFVKAREYLQKAVNDSNKITYGLNCFPSLALMYLALSSLILGKKNESREIYEKSIKSGEEEAQYSLMVVLTVGCYYHCFLKDYDAVKKNAEEILNIATEIGQHMYMRRAILFLNLCDVLLANQNKNNEIEKEINLLIDSGEEIEVTFYLGLLAVAFISTGHLTQAMKSVDKGIGFAEKNGEFFYLAELYRLKSELYKFENRNSDFNSLHNRSVVIANKQNAQIWMNMEYQ